jgi:pyruvate dehydrogenase E1 component alpha subunit
MSDPQKYRSKDEVEQYKQRDPVENVRQHILSNGLATEEDLAAIDQKIKATVDESVKFAEESPYPPAEEAFKDVYVQKDYPFLME